MPHIGLALCANAVVVKIWHVYVCKRNGIELVGRRRRASRAISTGLAASLTPIHTMALTESRTLTPIERL